MALVYETLNISLINCFGLTVYIINPFEANEISQPL